MFDFIQLSKLTDDPVLSAIYNFKSKGYYPQLLSRIFFFCFIKNHVVADWLKSTCLPASRSCLDPSKVTDTEIFI